MANQDTTVTPPANDEEVTPVETTPVEDEQVTTDPLTPVDDTETGKENEEETTAPEGETETETEEEAKFQKRFTQFEGETPEEYLKNLEEAHANAISEGQRKAQEAKKATEKFDKVAQLVASDPEFAKKLSEATGEDTPAPTVDPALEYAREQMEKDYTRDYKEFTDNHPSLLTDEAKQEAIIQEVDIISGLNLKRGVRLSMAEALNRAWISLGYDKDEAKDDVVNKAKDQASKPQAPAQTKKAPGKSQFTDEQIAVAKKMGLSPEQLAEYNK